MSQRFIRRPEVEKITGLSRASIYRQMQLGEFPKPIKITASAVGWLQTEIDAYMAKRIAARDAGQEAA